MSYKLKQSQTARPLLFLMVSATDHLAGVTGLSPTVTLSKNGAAFGAPAGAVSEVASGWYKVAGNATDEGTLGPLLLHATGTGADVCDMCYEVVSYDPDTMISQTGDAYARLGAPAGASVSADVAGVKAVLPAVAAGAKSGLPILDAATGLVITGYGPAPASVNASNMVAAAPSVTQIAADTTEILTRIPDATAGAAGGLPTVAAGGAKLAQTADLTAAQTIAATLADKTGFSLLAGHGLALEATLTAIKGAGWTTETLAALKTAVDAIQDITDDIVITEGKVEAVAEVTIDAGALETMGEAIAGIVVEAVGSGGGGSGGGGGEAGLAIGEFFEFQFNTHVFATGMASDADELPTFAVYEAGVDAAVLTDDCAKCDDAGTTGYYRARGEVTATAPVFTIGNYYEVRVEATVDGITGASCVGSFRVVDPTALADGLAEGILGAVVPAGWTQGTVGFNIGLLASGDGVYTNTYEYPAGVPIDGADVEAYDNEDHTGHPAQSTVTDVDGSFTLRLPRTTWYIVLDKPGFYHKEVTLVAGDFTEV